MTAPPIAIDYLSKRVGQAVADDDLSLTDAPGRVTRLLGNGSGRTTAMRGDSRPVVRSEPRRGICDRWPRDSSRLSSPGRAHAVGGCSGLNLDEVDRVAELELRTNSSI